MAHKLHTSCYVCRRTPSSRCLRQFHNYVQYHYDDSTLSTLTTTSWLPFDYSRNTVQRFHGYHFTWFCGYPLTILRIPSDDSMDTLWWFRGNPLTICELLTRQIRGYCKVSCDMYRSLRHSGSFIDRSSLFRMHITEGSTVEFLHSHIITLA